MRGAVLFVLALASGCAMGLPRCPEKGGPAWRSIETEHFVVYTDASSKKALEVASDLEYVRKALTQFLLPGGTGPAGRIPVLLLTGDGHFDQFFATGVQGGYTELFFQPTIFLAGRQALATATTIKHELTHYIVDGVVPGERMPRWVGEGLATFTETVQVDRARGRVTFGETTDERVVFALAKYDPDRIARYFDVDKMTSAEHAEYAFYGQSWLKVHYLINEARPQFALFLRRLREGFSEDDAWSQAFPRLPKELLDEKVAAYAKHGRYSLTTMEIAADEQQMIERPMADADVHGWRAVLFALRNIRAKKKGAGDLDALTRARAEIAEAERQDPGHVLAAAAEWLLDDTPTVDRGKRLTEAHPDDWLAWFLLSEAHAHIDSTVGRGLTLNEAVRLSAPNPAIRLKDTLDGKRERGGRHEPAAEKAAR